MSTDRLSADDWRMDRGTNPKDPARKRPRSPNRKRITSRARASRGQDASAPRAISRKSDQRHVDVVDAPRTAVDQVTRATERDASQEDANGERERRARRRADRPRRAAEGAHHAVPRVPPTRTTSRRFIDAPIPLTALTLLPATGERGHRGGRPAERVVDLALSSQRKRRAHVEEAPRNRHGASLRARRRARSLRARFGSVRRVRAGDGQRRELSAMNERHPLFAAAFSP